MEKEQIIKALDCCITGDVEECEKCPRHNIRTLTDAECMEGLNRDALALIKQQDDQIFQLENRLKECENGYSQTLGIERARIKELTEENERLKSEVSVKKKLLDKCVDLEDRVKDDTVKRFAEKLEITLMSRLVTATKEQKAAILFCINQINQTKAIMTKPKDCLQCKHFVGCEPSTLGGCDMYEKNTEDENGAK